MNMRTKTYSELLTLPTFEQRLDYLLLYGKVGHSTFGEDRYLNQRFYNSYSWRRIRNEVIVRDLGCDLGVAGMEILDRIYVHHMNPMTIDDIENNYDILLDPEYLICTSFNTHQVITFGNKNNLLRLPTERRRGDTKLW